MEQMMQAKEPVSYQWGVIPVVKALLISFLGSLILLAMAALVLWLAHVSEAVMRPVALVITLAAMVFCGKMTAKMVPLRGFVIGGLSGLCYMLILYGIALLAFDSVPFNVNVLVRFVYGFVAGAVGGVWGKNSMGKPHKMRHKPARS